MTGWVAVHLWQSSLITLIAWCVTLWCQRNGAEFRFLIWLGASLKFLVPLAALQWLGEHLGESLPQAPQVSPLLIEAANAMLRPTIQASFGLSATASWLLQLCAVSIWVSGTVLLAQHWFRQWRWLRGVLAASRPMVIDFPVPVYASSESLAPGVFGIWRPVVILPQSLLGQLTPHQLAAMLGHELCHIRRRDNLLAGLHKCVELLFWFHPLVWWLGSRLLHEREAACDECAIAAGHEPQVYAETLLTVSRWSVTTRFATAAAADGDLTWRIRRVIRPEPVHPIDDVRCWLLFAAIALLWLLPIFAGIVAGARRADFAGAQISLNTVRARPAEPRWRSSSHFDGARGQLVLRNVSLRQVIRSAYPWAHVQGNRYVIDGSRYDIEAHWDVRNGTNERATYRELLRQLLRDNFNVQLYVDRRCALECT